MSYRTYIFKRWPDYRSIERELVNTVNPSPAQLFFIVESFGRFGADVGCNLIPSDFVDNNYA